MAQPFTAESGYSMTEVLISTALGTIVLAGVFDLYVSSSNSILGQTNEIQMQSETRSAKDIMIRELRLIFGSPAITTTTNANDTISFTRIEESGYSSGGNTATTLKDSVKTWTVNAFAGGAYSVRIINGPGVGEVHPILSNTAATLTLSDAGWVSLPNTNSLYYITRDKTFRRQADNTVHYQIGSGTNNLLASNVTALTFSQPDPMSVSIALTARTQTVDPRTGKYASYQLSDTARKRN